MEKVKLTNIIKESSNEHLCKRAGDLPTAQLRMRWKRNAISAGAEEPIKAQMYDVETTMRAVRGDRAGLSPLAARAYFGQLIQAKSGLGSPHHPQQHTSEPHVTIFAQAARPQRRSFGLYALQAARGGIPHLRPMPGLSSSKLVYVSARCGVVAGSPNRTCPERYSSHWGRVGRNWAQIS